MCLMSPTKKPRACSFCAEFGHTVTTCQHRKKLQFQYKELITKDEKFNLKDIIESSQNLKCIYNFIGPNQKPFIDEISSKMKRSHFIVHDAYTINQESKQHLDICHDIIADISFLSNSGLVPDDQSHFNLLTNVLDLVFKTISSATLIVM